MAVENELRKEVGEILTKIAKIPQISIRNQIFSDIIQWCAKALNIIIEERK